MADELPDDYDTVRWGGRWYVTYRDGETTWVLDERGFYAGRVDMDKPAWPGAYRTPKSFTSKARALAFLRIVTAPGWHRLRFVRRASHGA